MLLLSPPNRPHCMLWDRAYVKSNGRCACGCSAGESHTIIHPDLSKVDFVTDVLNGPQMVAMRLAFLQRRLHYIRACAKCSFLTDSVKFGANFRYVDHDVPDDTKQATKVATAVAALDACAASGQPYGSIATISELQLEPSFFCNLRCGGCLQGMCREPLTTEKPPYLFPLEWHRAILSSCVAHKVALTTVTYVGRGEPTICKWLGSIIATTKELCPTAYQSMDTNATQPFKDEYLGLDNIHCSVDGSDQESYGLYRRGGRFDATIQFMRDAVAARRNRGSGSQIIWKYILFTTNDSESQLDHAQELAQELDVDALRFVITSCGSADKTVRPSRRFTTADHVRDYMRRRPIFSKTAVVHA